MELELKSASLRQLIVHLVGSKNNLDPVHLSDDIPALDPELVRILGESFLNKFSNNFEYYRFHHASSLSFNEVYSYTSDLFRDKAKFLEVSQKLARHLYDSSTHPKVKGGEFYVVLFEGLPVEGRMHTALGLFKTENKQLFLDVQLKGRKLELEMKEGVELTKIDKGCLILNTAPDEGFDVLLFDSQNRGEEALYWKETFLGLTPRKNEFHHTNHFLTLTKQFITEQLESEFGLPKNEQISLLNKSIDYFRSNESFNIDEFQSEVFGSEQQIESFRQFGSRYTEHHNFDIASEFGISGPAVKKQTRIFKSVLKLDRNFHIYIHGNTDLIEKGVDLDGRKYYKIYYQEES